jgi:hypothetical protein
MHDHTGNFSTAIDGVNTPELDQADNDYAVGLLVQQIANSQYKNNTLIFVIEDDSQDGADHVDSHRRLVDPGLLDSVGYRRLGLLVLGVEMAKSSGQSTACGVVSDRVVDDTAKPDRQEFASLNVAHRAMAPGWRVENGNPRKNAVRRTNGGSRFGIYWMRFGSPR